RLAVERDDDLVRGRQGRRGRIRGVEHRPRRALIPAGQARGEGTAGGRPGVGNPGDTNLALEVSHGGRGGGMPNPQNHPAEQPTRVGGTHPPAEPGVSRQRRHRHMRDRVTSHARPSLFGYQRPRYWLLICGGRAAATAAALNAAEITPEVRVPPVIVHEVAILPADPWT